MDPQENTRSTQETMTIEWVLSFPHFEDTEKLVPKDLNSTPVICQYKEILAKQVRKRYFEVECYKIQQPKRRGMK